MNINFSKRIFTSIILLFILFICLFLSKILWFYLLIAASIISYFEFNNLIKKINSLSKQKKILTKIISSIYLIFFIFVGYSLYNSSKFILLFILLICIFSDTGGYLVGKTFGGKKLTKISPNKTISGSVGSFVFSLFSIIIFIFLDNVDHQNLLFKSKILSMPVLIIICLFLSFICQLGDLLISYFKRKAKIKDTGSLLPGHGGLLDRIDGLIFVMPVTYLLIQLFS